MRLPLNVRFENFLGHLPGSEGIPSDRNLEDGERQGDYFLQERKIVAEVKTLKASPHHRGEAVVAEYLTHTGIRIWGTHPLSRIAENEGHLSAIEKAISRRMTRGIEGVCKSADKQIGSECSRLPHLATGLLILINENVTALHPRVVSDRVVDFTKSKPTNIHYCLLIFESHRALIGSRLVYYPLLLDLTYSVRQRRAGQFLKGVQNDWARLNGLPDGLPDPEPMEIAYYPDSITFGR